MSAMLDPKLIRESPDLVRAAIAKKHLDADLDAVLALDASWRAQLQDVEALRSQQKGNDKEITHYHLRRRKPVGQLNQQGEKDDEAAGLQNPHTTCPRPPGR